MANYNSTITIGVSTVLDESKLTETEAKLTDLKETLNNTFTNQEDVGRKDIFESALGSVESLSASVAGLRTIFADLGTSLSGNVTNAMRIVEQSISAMQRNLVSAAKAGFSSDSLNKVLMNSVSLSESSGLISKLIQNHSKDLGWSQAQFSQKMPLIMSQIINPEVKKLSETAFLRDRPNFDRYVDALVQNSAVRRSLESMSGTKMSTEQARANIERGLLLYNQRATQAFGANAVARAPFQRAAATIQPHDIIPEQFRGAYYGRGFTRTDAGADAEKAFLASLQNQGANYVSRSTYKALRDYVQNNENGIALHDILREAGIMDVRGGTRQWAKHLTVAQASLLGGLSARELYNAKRGYAFYDADPNDSANDVRVDHRMSRRVQAHLGLMDILSRDSRITPSTNYSLEDLAAQNADYVVRVGTTAKTRIKGNKVTETGTPDQFVMPLTQIDTRSGQLIYRDPAWRKKSGLYEEKEDDQFAIMTDNPLAQLIRQIGYTGKGGHKFGYGNGTFGYGRNDRGEAIYDTPPILKINTDQFFQTDENGFDRRLDPAKEQQFRRILRGQQFTYGDRNYEYAYQGDSGVYMIESELKKQIDQWYEKRNLPSFFAGLNEGGLESIGDYGKLIKQINGLKKGSSTAQAYEDVFGALEGHGKNGALNTRVANLTAWYKALGYEDVDIPDGAAFGNSNVFRNGPLQMRSAVGFGKYVLNPYNLEQVFGAATAGFTKDQIANMGESHGNNWLFSKGANDGVQVWIPSITATQEDVEALKTGQLSEAQKEQFGSLSELRKQRFFVGNDENNDLILSDKTAKQFEAFKFLSGKHYAAEYGEEAFEQAKREKRYDAAKGLVTLLPHEQGEMHERATPAYMVMRSAWDYANDPNIISQQSFAAWGGNQELRERSDDEFARRIYRLRTAEGRMEALKANPFYERMLNQNPNFAYSTEASGYIEKQIRELQDKQLAGYIAINPNDAVDKDGNKIEGIRSAYRVAALTPGALIEPILRAAGISDENIDSAVRSLLPSRMDASKLVYTGKGISGRAGQIMQINRDPDAAGQQIQVSSMYSTEAIRNKMREFGVSDAMADQAIFLSQRQANALNTGDFDGDTVRAYLGLPEEALARAAQIQEAINAEKAKYEKAQSVRDVQEVKKPAVSVEQARLDALTRYFDSTKVMGQASKILRESMNLPDTDQTKWSRIYEGMKLYDFASSEMRTKGLDAVISEYGLETIKGGNSFERFLANMRKESGKEDEDLKAAHLGRDIFKTNLPSWNSPQGIVASLMRGREVLAGKGDYSDFKASMSKLIDMEYGDAKTPEAKAARWYADKYTKTAFGRLLTRDDLSEGDELAYQWLRSLNARNVGQDAEEYRQYNRFAKRLGTIREADSMTYENMLERSASLQSAMGRETNEDKRRELQAQWALTEEAIKNHDTYEKDLSKLDNIKLGEEVKEQRKAAEDAKLIEAQLKKEQEAEQQIDTSKDVWGRQSVAANWSNFKSWIHKPIQLTGAKQLTSSGAPIETTLDPILFNDYAARVAVASSELYGSKDETDHIVIGNAMHKAFEDYWKGVAEGTLDGRTIDDYFTQLVFGNGDYARKLSDLGYKIRKTSKEGQPERYEAVGPEGTGLTKLNNLLRTSTNKGVSSMADFIVALDQTGFDIEHPANIEGNFYKYDKQGNFEGADNTGKYEMKLSIPIKDENGQITGYDESKTTHARPDLMLRNKNDNGLYVVDYKSRYEGAAESLVQSAFYTSVIDTLAKRAWTGVHESEKDAEGNLRKLSDAERAELESFKAAGHIENGKYVSDIKGAVGFDPRTRRSIMISREGENAQYFDEGVQLATEALASKRIDAKGLLENGSAYIRAMMNEATISRQVDNQLDKARTAITDSDGHLIRNMNDAEREFFLSRYQADREAISGVRSSIFKERDLPERYFNRFEGYERKLKEALPEEVVSAVMQSYAKDGYIDMNSPVIAELSEEMKEKARLLKDVQELGVEAATKDWEKVETDISRTFSGIGQTKAESTIESVNRRVKQAESSRDFLKSRMIEVTDENGNKTMVPVYTGYQKDSEGKYRIADQAFTIEEQAQMFDTENANEKVAARARTMKDEFLRSVRAQEQVERMIEASSEKFLKEDAVQQDQTWSSIIGEVKDPATVLSQALTKKAATAQKQIDTWNSEIQEWSDKLEKNDVSASTREIYKKLIADRQARVANAENDVRNGLVEKSALEDEKRRLGMMAETPKSRAQKWLDERLAVINQEASLRYDNTNERLKRMTEADVNNYSLSAEEREAAQRAYEESRRINELQKKQEIEDRSAPYIQQANALEEMYNRQENRPYEDFINKANRNVLSRDERVQQQLDDMMAYATQQAVNKDLSDKARANWTNLLGNKEFWDQQREQLTQQNLQQETLRQKYEQNQIDAIRDQNAARIDNMNWQFKNANRQQQMRYSSSRMANAIYSVQQRRESAQVNLDTINRQVAAEQRNSDYWKERMKAAPEGSKDYEDASYAYAQSQEKLSGFTSAAKTAQEQLNQLNSKGTMSSAVFGSFSQSVDMLLKRFGRQMFTKAINEAKQFVKQYDKTMTEIQMITLKSDSEMGQVSDSIIGKAKELKVSIGEVSQSAATLYRQGLSDQEVDDRLGVISKFSRVSGTKVADATKLITVAMNTGLITDAMEASDIVTALGDNAATNAQQIEKGIEKAGAAAAADGTTFGQLAAMLTAITSTTQIGGNVAGRTLNTIFGRMNKIGTNELIIDENGNSISGSAVAKLLKKQGIDMYDENGNKQSSFNTLRALSQKWEGMTDAEQQQMANAIAGTRQYSNFAAIMQGMTEGKIDDYLNLIGESSGITDKKFDVYKKSLEANLTDLKNTFDSTINDLVDKGVFTDIVSGLKDMIAGIGSLVSSAGGLKTLIIGLGSIALLTGFIRGGVPGAIAAGALVAGLGLSYIVGSAQNSSASQQPSERYNNYIQEENKEYAERDTSINRLKELSGNNNRSEDETKELLYLGKTLGNYAGASDAVSGLSSAISGLGSAASGAISSVSNLANNIAEQAEEKQAKDRVITFAESFSENNGGTKLLSDAVNNAVEEYETGNYGTDIRLSKIIRQYNERNPEAKLDEKANNPAETLFNILDYAKSTNGFDADLIENISELAEYLSKRATSGIDRNIDIQDVINTYNYGNTEERENAKEILQKVFGSIVNTANADYEFTGGVGTSQKEAFKNQLNSIISKNENLPFKREYIPHLLDVITDEIFSSFETGENGEYIIPENFDMESSLLQLFGVKDENGNVTINPDSFNKKVLELLSLSDYKATEESLENSGLEQTTKSGYYIDTRKKIGQKGYIVSREEAAEISPEDQEYLKAVKSSALYGASYDEWENDKKNAYQVAANRLYNSVSSANDFGEIIDIIEGNERLNASMLTLYENADFKKLMSQVSRDETTGELTYPENMVDQFKDFLLANGTYGKTQIKRNTKFNNVSSVLRGLSGETEGMMFRSRQDYEDFVQNQYDAYIQRENELKDQIYNQAVKHAGEENAQDVLNKFLEGHTTFTKDEYANRVLRSAYENLNYVDDATQGYMEEIFGKEFASILLSPTATKADFNLAKTLNQRYLEGRSGLTQQDKTEQLKRILEMSPSEIKEYWENSEYAARQYGAGFNNFETFMSLAANTNRTPEQEERYQTLRTELSNYIRDTDISEVTNRLKTQESAGKIQSGTSSLYEGLVSANAETRKNTVRDIENRYYEGLKAKEAAKNLAGLTEANWGSESGEYLSVLGSYLGWSENKKDNFDFKDRKQALEEVNEENSKFLDQMKVLASALTGTDFSSVESVSSLLSAVGDAGGEAAAGLQSLLESLSGMSAAKTLDDVFENNAYAQNQADRSTIGFLAQMSAGTTVSGLVGDNESPFADMDALNNFLNRNQAVKDIFEQVMADNGGVFRQEDIDKLTEMTAYGMDNRDTALLNGYQEMQEARNEQGGYDVDKLRNLYDTSTDFKKWADDLGGFENVLSDVEGTATGAGKSIETFLAAFNTKAIANELKTKNVTEGLSDTLASMRKSGSEGTAALNKYRSTLTGYRRDLELLKKYTGKNTSGKNVASRDKQQIAQLLGIPNADDLSLYKAEDFQKMIEEKRGEILDRVTNDMQAEFDQELKQAFIDKGINQSEIDMDQLSITIDASGGVHVDTGNIKDEISGKVNEAIQQAYASFTSRLGVLGTLFFNVLGFGKGLQLTLTEGSEAPPPSGGGGGGGGKKKSALDKLLEKQAEKIAKLQHKQNMAQIYENKYDYLNDYGGLDANYDEQLANEEALRKQHEKNIAKLKKQLKKTKDPEERKKIKEQIRKEEEEAAKNETNAYEIKKKKYLTSVDERQTNRQKPLEHERSILDILASRGQITGNYDMYAANTRANMAKIRDKQAMNNEDIEEWKKQLAQVEEGSDLWIEIRDKIYQKEEENAQLENDYLQKQNELIDERLNNVAKILNQRTQAAQHALNMNDIWGGYYQTAGYRQQYESSIRDKYAYYDTLIAENQVARDEALATAQEALAEGNTDKYHEAMQAVYGYDEAIAQATVDQLLLNEALNESKIEGIAEAFNDATMDLRHTDDLLKSVANDALERNDFGMYERATDMWIKNEEAVLKKAEERRDSAKAHLADLLNPYDKNGNKKSSDQMATPEDIRKAEEAVEEAENEVVNTRLAISKANRDLVKNRIDRMLNDQQWTQANYEHNQKLLGYQTSTYQNRGELTNYGLSLEEDTRLRTNRVKVLEQEKDSLYEALNNVEKGSEEEKRITEEIRKHEEAIASENAQIDKNNKMLEENRKKIMQVQKTLEDAVDKEIEAQKKRDKEILASNVSLQAKILDLFKKRLQDEWNLKKKDLEKEKESLAEYKKLINERFNYRKKASQQADKDEQLADYRRQLALIEADPTRSKDAKELRKKIEDLEKERSWAISEDEVAAEGERIDNQTEAINKYLQYGEETLKEFLSDANNFSAQIAEVMEGTFSESYDRIINFFKETDEAFIKSLPFAQQQTTENLTDLIKKAKDVVDTNFPEIAGKDLFGFLYDDILDENGNPTGKKVLKSYSDLVNGTIKDEITGKETSYRDAFIEAYKELDFDYRKASEEGNVNAIRLLELGYGKSYDDLLNSLKNDFSFKEDTHLLNEVSTKIDELENNEFTVKGVDELIKIAEENKNNRKIEEEQEKLKEEERKRREEEERRRKEEEEAANVMNTNGKIQPDLNNFTPISGGNPPVDTPAPPPSTNSGGIIVTDSGEHTAGDGSKFDPDNATPINIGDGYLVSDPSGKIPTTSGSTGNGSSGSAGNGGTGGNDGNSVVDIDYLDYSDTHHKKLIKYKNGTIRSITEAHKYTNNKCVCGHTLGTVYPGGVNHEQTRAFASGGLVDYTGIAWVDGTKARPEAFLSATDTENIRAMLDMFGYISVAPLTHVDNSAYGNTTNIGDINITINQAEISSDYDIDKLAKQVGQAFTKELKRNGINTAGYAF